MKSGIPLLALVLGSLLAHSPAALCSQNNPQSVVTKDSPAPMPEAVRKAVSQAAASGRDVIVIFNSSDTGGWCEKIRADILQKSEFASAAANRFVTVTLDFPAKAGREPEKSRLIENAYARRYRITAYPVILLLDRNGRPYSKIGYKPGGAAAYAAHLATVRMARERRDTLLAKALKTKGDTRAELLAGALRTIDATLAPDYADLFEQLRAADPVDRRGIVLEYDLALLAARARAATAATHNREAGLREFDAFLAARPGLPDEKLQRVLHGRFAFVPTAGDDGLSRQARCQRRCDQLRAMLELAPKSALAPAITRLLDEENAELERLREENTGESD